MAVSIGCRSAEGLTSARSCVRSLLTHSAEPCRSSCTPTRSASPTMRRSSAIWPKQPHFVGRTYAEIEPPLVGERIAMLRHRMAAVAALFALSVLGGCSAAPPSSPPPSSPSASASCPTRRGWAPPDRSSKIQ